MAVADATSGFVDGDLVHIRFPDAMPALGEMAPCDAGQAAAIEFSALDNGRRGGE